MRREIPPVIRAMVAGASVKSGVQLEAEPASVPGQSERRLFVAERPVAVGEDESVARRCHSGIPLA
jgi:hypothetical protein